MACMMLASMSWQEARKEQLLAQPFMQVDRIQVGPRPTDQ